MQYRELRAARAFGKMPHEFFAAPKRSRIQAIAFVEADQTIENYLGEI
ncbi:MAG: hypothetical protein PHN44_04540 [Candidatus Marinimicrobia bacterium]|nr:hypothetical protein [Candidatus Neomarinimicrobiota bacterium]MDD5539913.1 hypothetical protein [Candidatus Neomarinimicrobiota bacterium]